MRVFGFRGLLQVHMETIPSRIVSQGEGPHLPYCEIGPVRLSESGKEGTLFLPENSRVWASMFPDSVQPELTWRLSPVFYREVDHFELYTALAIYVISGSNESSLVYQSLPMHTSAALPLSSVGQTVTGRTRFLDSPDRGSVSGFDLDRNPTEGQGTQTPGASIAPIAHPTQISPGNSIAWDPPFPQETTQGLKQSTLDTQLDREPPSPHVLPSLLTTAGPSIARSASRSVQICQRSWLNPHQYRARNMFSQTAHQSTVNQPLLCQLYRSRHRHHCRNLYQ